MMQVTSGFIVLHVVCWKGITVLWCTGNWSTTILIFFFFGFCIKYIMCYKAALERIKKSMNELVRWRVFPPVFLLFLKKKKKQLNFHLCSCKHVHYWLSFLYLWPSWHEGYIPLEFFQAWEDQQLLGSLQPLEQSVSSFSKLWHFFPQCSWKNIPQLESLKSHIFTKPHMPELVHQTVHSICSGTTSYAWPGAVKIFLWTLHTHTRINC